MRPSWSGHMRLSLVSCPIALSPATTEVERIKLNQLNPRTGNRLPLQPVDSETGEKVNRGDIVKGYKLENDQYVILENEELKNLKIESSSILDLEHFVDRASVDPIYVDTPYYIYPDKSGLEAYRVIAEAMLMDKKAAIGRIVMSNREHPVLVEPRGGGLMMYILRAADEVRAAEYDFPEIKLDRKMIDIAATIMERQAGKFEPDQFRDRYQDALRELIESKTNGGPPKKTTAPATGGNVVDLMDALRRSLAGGKPPAARQAPAPVARAGKKSAKADKRQASLLLPIKGAEKEKAPAAPRAATPRTAARRKRA
jgi:DNA end-binding protein Ku